MLEAITEDGPEGKAFNIFCFKEPEYVMMIMATWMTLKELDGVDMRQEYKGRYGQSLIRQFKDWHPFGLHFRYRHQVDDHSNRRHATISLEKTWETKFLANRNFAWYLAVTEMKTEMAYGHFRKGGKLIPNLQFRGNSRMILWITPLGWELCIIGGPGGQHAC